MDQEITLYIFNISQMDMASRRFIVSTRETEVLTPRRYQVHSLLGGFGIKPFVYQK
jgi:hypothetical protein